MSLEQDVVLLREPVAQLLAVNTQLRQQIDPLQAPIARLVKRTFGRSSERVLGPTLFGERVEEAAVESRDTPLSPEPIVPVELVPKRKGHGRKTNAVDLPRRREELVLSDAEKACPCCCAPRVQT